MKKINILFACLILTGIIANSATKYVGGDISLLTKYEER